MTQFRRQEMQVVQDFAGQLGVAARAAPDGSYSFTFDRSGTLTLTPAEEPGRTVVSLGRSMGRLDEGLMTRALQKAGFDDRLNTLVHAGITGDDVLLFSVVVDEREFSLPYIENCLQHLIGLHGAVR